MLDRLRPVPVYIKLFKNKVEISRLDTGKTITRAAKDNFSNERFIIADLFNAESLIREVLTALVPPFLFISPTLKIVIQQIDRSENGLSSVERRTLLDIAEHCGGITVRVVESTKELTPSQAVKKLKEKN